MPCVDDEWRGSSATSTATLLQAPRPSNAQRAEHQAAAGAKRALRNHWNGAGTRTQNYRCFLRAMYNMMAARATWLATGCASRATLAAAPSQNARAAAGQVWERHVPHRRRARRRGVAVWAHHEEKPYNSAKAANVATNGTAARSVRRTGGREAHGRVKHTCAGVCTRGGSRAAQPQGTSPHTVLALGAVDLACKWVCGCFQGKMAARKPAGGGEDRVVSGHRVYRRAPWRKRHVAANFGALACPLPDARRPREARGPPALGRVEKTLAHPKRRTRSMRA